MDLHLLMYTGLIRILIIKPSGNKTVNLGLSSYQWKTIWGGTLYENGQTLSSKYALKTEIPANVESITNSEIDDIFA